MDYTRQGPGARRTSTSIPFGVADVKREGEDMTIDRDELDGHVALEAAELLAEQTASRPRSSTRARSSRSTATTLVALASRRRAARSSIDEGHQSYGATAELAAVDRRGGVLAARRAGAAARRDGRPDPVLARARGRDRADARARRRDRRVTRRKEEVEQVAIRTYGTMAVDWEQRVDFDRLRRERLARAKRAPGGVGAGRAPLLRHEQHPLHHRDPHRHVGDGQADPLLPAAARTASRSCGTSARRRGTTRSTARGSARSARAPASRRCAGRSRDAPSRSREKIRVELEEHGLLDEPLGVDMVELPVLFALERRASRSSTGRR